MFDEQGQERVAGRGLGVHGVDLPGALQVPPESLAIYAAGEVDILRDTAPAGEPYGLLRAHGQAGDIALDRANLLVAAANGEHIGRLEDLVKAKELSGAKGRLGQGAEGCRASSTA
jgi:hypothetical protein